VDESIADAPRLVSGQVSVRRVVGGVRTDVARKLGSVVAVVMEMELDLTETGPSKTPERVQVPGSVLFARKKERVSRRTSVGISEGSRELGVVVFPPSDSSGARRVVGATPQRLEVVAEREQHVTHAVGLPKRACSEPMSSVPDYPAMQVLVVERKCNHVAGS
jgi:hypothetical protein